jgi:hypothetical protein
MFLNYYEKKIAAIIKRGKGAPAHREHAREKHGLHERASAHAGAKGCTCTTCRGSCGCTGRENGAGAGRGGGSGHTGADVQGPWERAPRRKQTRR